SPSLSSPQRADSSLSPSLSSPHAKAEVLRETRAREHTTVSRWRIDFMGETMSPRERGVKAKSTWYAPANARPRRDFSEQVPRNSDFAPKCTFHCCPR